MTIGLILVRSNPGRREHSLSGLEEIQGDKKFQKQNGFLIKDIYVSFGWPDFVIMLDAKNVARIKNGIVKIRKRLLDDCGDGVETSTIICSSISEINAELKKIK